MFTAAKTCECHLNATFFNIPNDAYIQEMSSEVVRQQHLCLKMVAKLLSLMIGAASISPSCLIYRLS